MAELVRLHLTLPRWRIVVARAAVVVLVAVEYALPSLVDAEVVSQRLARFIVAGAKVTQR